MFYEIGGAVSCLPPPECVGETDITTLLILHAVAVMPAACTLVHVLLNVHLPACVLAATLVADMVDDIAYDAGGHATKLGGDHRVQPGYCKTVSRMSHTPSGNVRTMVPSCPCVRMMVAVSPSAGRLLALSYLGPLYWDIRHKSCATQF